MSYKQQSQQQEKAVIWAVKKAKADRKDPEKKHWLEVGTAIIRQKNGTLYLNFLDGDFALFPKDQPEKAGAAG